MTERNYIDGKKYRLIAEVGLKQEKYRLNYASEPFQELVHAAFGEVLPQIRQDEAGRYFHVCLGPDGKDWPVRHRAIKAGESWPKQDVRLLLDGCARLREMARQQKNPRVRMMLQNFQLPDLEREPHCYRIYRDALGHARLLVLHGFVRNGPRQPYYAENLVESLRARHLLPEGPTGSMGAIGGATAALALGKPTSRRMPQTVSSVLSVACVLSLAAVFFAVYLTTMPALLAEQAPELDPISFLFS